MATSGNRAVDILIAYRVIKLLVTPFERQDAYKLGIIDKDGKVLRKYKTLQKSNEKRAYTFLHRFVFNLKRILKRVGLGGKFGSFAVATALLFKENKSIRDKIPLIENSIIRYLKETNQYDKLLKEEGHIEDREYEEQPYATYFGVDVYERGDELISERENA